ncbi:zinc finger and BTB domain-containing protein 32 isoform X2 [Monodelphis domestica]|uniref:zinc finger and BTB domain-containing protein 32 isoform X2 n=1 Tax=Monodelphis domestica TaxID=13616 RepID=UPI0024E22D27|nr:zinc finger and BTB domain-containing protein 32 isoform X2 [Monodelphis domestica]
MSWIAPPPPQPPPPRSPPTAGSALDEKAGKWPTVRAVNRAWQGGCRGASGGRSGSGQAKERERGQRRRGRSGEGSRSLLSPSPPTALWGRSLLDNLGFHKSSISCPGSLQSGPAQPSSNERNISDQGSSEGGSPSPYGNCVSRVGGPPRASRPLPSGPRPCPCPGCGKKFSLKHQMETHYRAHTGEKPFSCRLCPQRSRDFSAMTKHLRTHGTAPYRCPLCQAGCPSLTTMQAHMRSHPPGQLPPGWTIRSTFLYSSSRPSPSSSNYPHITASPTSTSSSSPSPSLSSAT